MTVLAAGEELGGPVPEVLDDAHKRLYPPFLVISRQDTDASSMADAMEDGIPKRRQAGSRPVSAQRPPSGTSRGSRGLGA